MDETSENADGEATQNGKKHPIRDFYRRHESGIKLFLGIMAAASILALLDAGNDKQERDKIKESHPVDEDEFDSPDDEEIRQAVNAAQDSFSPRIIDTNVSDSTVSFNIKSASGKQTWPQHFELEKDENGTWNATSRWGTIDNGSYSTSPIPDSAIREVLNRLND